MKTCQKDTSNRHCVRLEISLPVPLPSANVILAMHHRVRKKLRDLTDQMVLLALSQSHIETLADGSLMRITDGQNTSQMLLFQQEYYEMTGRKRSPKGRKSSKEKPPENLTIIVEEI